MKEQFTFKDRVRSTFSSVWKKKEMIVLITILFLLIGISYSSFQIVTNIYCAQAVICDSSFEGYPEHVSKDGLLYRYADVLYSEAVCERAEAMIAEQSVTKQAIQEMVSYEINEANSIMTVQVKAKNPTLCLKVANAVSESFISELQSKNGENYLTLMSRAKSATLYQNGFVRVCMVIAAFGLAGFVLSVLYYIILTVCAKRIHIVEQCMETSKNELIGVIPMMNSDDK